MNLWVRLKIEEILINILEDLRPTLKESLKDPYMVNKYSLISFQYKYQ